MNAPAGYQGAVELGGHTGGGERHEIELGLILVRYYFCSDNLKNEKYRGLTPHDLIDIAMINNLHYDGTSQEGVMFHLIGALSEYGKLGIVCIGSSPERAEYFYNETVRVLNAKCS